MQKEKRTTKWKQSGMTREGYWLCMYIKPYELYDTKIRANAQQRKRYYSKPNKIGSFNSYNSCTKWQLTL